LFTFFSPNYYDEKENVIIDITQRCHAHACDWTLYARKIIPNKTNVKIAAFIYGADRKIKAGVISYLNGLSYLS
jgi:cell division protein YceG involved in septum cleavage